MKKLLFLFLLSFPTLVFSAPSTTMSISPSASDGTVITASDENTRNNSISTVFNAHTHTDISQVGNTLAVGDATAGNKTLTANNADSNKPYIRYDDTADTWNFSVDGTIVSHSLSPVGIVFEGSSDNAFETAIQVANPTVDRAATFPDASGEVTLLGQTLTKLGTFTRDMTAASGSVTYTGVGFTPSRVIFFGVVAGNAAASVGFSDGPTNNLANTNEHNNVADTWGPSSSRAIYLTTATGNNRQDATISSFNSDGFVLSWTKESSPTGTATIYYMAIK